MSSITPMEQLSEQLHKATKIVADYLRINGHTQPSFDRDSPPNTLPADAPHEIKAARLQIVDCTLKIQQLALGPAEFLPNLQVSVCSCVFSFYNHLQLKLTRKSRSNTLTPSNGPSTLRSFSPSLTTSPSPTAASLSSRTCPRTSSSPYPAWP